MDNKPRVVIPELKQALLDLASEADPDPLHLVGEPGDNFEIGSDSYLGADVFRHLGWLSEDGLIRASCDDLGLGRRRWLVRGLTAAGAEKLDRLWSGDHPDPVDIGSGRLPHNVPEWFKDRYDELKAAGKSSSRDQDIAACREKYGFAVPEHLIRSLRKVLKPPEWQDKGGRPPSPPKK